MTPRTRWTMAGVILAAAGLLAWAFMPRPLAVELATAVQGRFEVTIDEDARTRLADRYVVSAPLAGRLSRITLREGDRVAAGDVVAVLSALPAALLDPRAQQEQAARVEAASAQLRAAEAGVGRARVATQQARLVLDRGEALAASGFLSPTQLDTDRLTLRAAERELEIATQTRQVAAHELALARVAADVAGLGAGASARTVTLRAPVAGQVLRVLQPSEATVPAGSALLELGDLSRLEIVAPLLTTDALQTRPGTAVRIERWGGSGELEGRVRRVEPAAFTKISALGVEEQRVHVLIDLTSPRERWQALGDGFRVGVRVIVQSVDAALTVPGSAVFPLPADEPGRAGGAAAFVVRDGRARQVSVELGGRNASQAWVRSGLAPGDRVVVYPPPTLRDGDRVRERRP